MRSFNVPVPETDVRQRAAAFFTQAGYRQIPDSGGSLHFMRGSTQGTLTSFDPTRWACIVNVGIQSEGTSSVIKVEVGISSDPTEKHFAEELLTAEFNLLGIAVTKNEFKTFDITNLKKRVNTHVSRVAGIFSSFLITLILAVVAGLFASIDLSLSIVTASATGAGVLLIFGGLLLAFWGRRKKN